MTEKKTKGKKVKADEVAANQAFVANIGDTASNDDAEVSFDDIKHLVVPELVHQYERTVEALVTIKAPERGPDYHITAAGEILLDTGDPIPEDHPVHPAHRALAAARKSCK